MTSLEERLTKTLGDRVSVDPVERMLYAHDMGSMPAMVEKMVCRTPAAVAQPRTKEELSFLVSLAAAEGLPIVPRGNATSGYGGSVPVKGGLVVDFTQMNRIMAIDPKAETVRVEPGAIWTELQETLKESGLDLRLYPSSAPGSTVGGWVAEGGSGIGSYAYGYIADNVVEIETILPDGRFKTWTGKELATFSGTEGILGLIISVTLKVAKAEPESFAMAAFPDFAAAVSAIGEVTRAKLPIWHINMETPAFAARAGEAEGTSSLPSGKVIVLFVGRGDAGRKAVQLVEGIVASKAGQMLPGESAAHAWANRCYPMRIKKLGPSIVPGECLVPLANLPAALAEMEAKIPGLLIEGNMASPDKMVLLGFILADERARSFTFDYSQSLVMLEIARKHGGSPYSIGMFLAYRAGEKYKNLGEITQLKKQIDPKNLFNPGKVLPGQIPNLERLMRMAETTKSLGKLGAAVVGRGVGSNRKLPTEIERDAYACARCGYCKRLCTLHAGRTWESATPRGKWMLLRKYMKGEIKFNEEIVKDFLLCTTCKRCDGVCQVDIPIQHRWDALRGILIQRDKLPTFPAFEMMGASVEGQKNIWAGKRDRRDSWFPKDISYEPKAEIGYWAGCTASMLETEIAENAVRILHEGGVKFTYLGKDEACCGAPMFMAGKWDVFEEIVRYNIAEIKKRGIKTLVLSCPGCWMTLSHTHREWGGKLGLTWDVEIKHISEITQELIEQGRLKLDHPVNETVTWHDSCHMGRHGGIYDPPRKVLQSIPGLNMLEMKHNREDALCCGSVLTRIGDSRASDKIADIRIKEAEDIGAGCIVSTCPCCEFQLRVGAKATGSDTKIRDFSGYVVRALGYETRDTSAACHEMWSVFDIMIDLMTVPAMVEMMKDVMPQMLQAMPGVMKSMVSMVQHLPGPVANGMFAMMEKMIPKMMPMLLPGMMPQVLPDVIGYMKDKAPNMPPDMLALMPEMLPKVMDRLMPAMLPQMAPQLAPFMVEKMRITRF